ncbi:ABC-type Fe3+-siderophore transport system, permease component [Belliella baltica DSM 15883]|uniref:ABC-type Fe3+-siderophore transport system, permease component n=1 Tax=Belliella baltica (strain DSM 15883 / CIP 108006 / LMG 21964 / BA134) TaxID=866536 RepID=I3ZAQ1_BELBD|nr:iron ABC transporter permease [Belliella baltica]AFL86319.1 ABC-type Fe3+-siderophore transport system, permease component [Belliella baltica DSM 15883]
MKNNTRHFLLFVFGAVLCVLFFLINLNVGSVHIPMSEIAASLFGEEFSKKSWGIIVKDYRIPKAFTAILAGLALSISGLQMQTFFRNPLAGPFVLGISSGAGLGVALLVMTGSAFGLSFFSGGFGMWAVVFAASSGAILVLLLMSLTAWRVKDSMTLLIVGLMFGSLAGALISVLAYFSEAEQLKVFTIWSMGSLGGTQGGQLELFLFACVLGVTPVLIFIKSYNAMLLGEAYAKSMGVNINKLRWAMILSTGLLAGSATAFCGPIAFIGIAVPHMARLIFKSGDHKILFPASALTGAIVLLFCDSISQLPGSAQTLPINAVTSLIGAPMVIWLILRRNFSKEF